MDETNDWFIKTKIKRNKEIFTLGYGSNAALTFRPLKDQTHRFLYRFFLPSIRYKPVYQEVLYSSDNKLTLVGRLRILLSLSMRLSGESLEPAEQLSQKPVYKMKTWYH